MKYSFEAHFYFTIFLNLFLFKPFPLFSNYQFKNNCRELKENYRPECLSLFFVSCIASILKIVSHAREVGFPVKTTFLTDPQTMPGKRL